MAQKRKLTDEQIVAVVKQLEAGRTAAEMAREIGVSTYTIYSWKAKFGGLEPNEATKLRHLDDENSRLKKLVAELVRCPGHNVIGSDASHKYETVSGVASVECGTEIRVEPVGAIAHVGGGGRVSRSSDPGAGRWLEL